MLKFLSDFKDKKFDVIYCVSSNDGGVDFYGHYYKGDVTRTEETEFGSKYHIILYKEDSKGLLYNVDMFEAILTDPLEYLSGLLPSGWFGVFFKKTTVSDTIAQLTFDEMTKK